VLTSDPRCYPLIELSRRQIKAMLEPVLGAAQLHECVRVEGGLVNTIYRITTGHTGFKYALRVYATDNAACAREARLLTSLAKTLPVPEVLFADAGGQRCAYPYLVYQWLEGISLNECRKQIAPAAFLTLAAPLGRLLAQLASAAVPPAQLNNTLQLTTQLERADKQLRTGLARRRLGGALADALRHCLARSSSVCHTLDDTLVLVHGDFSGRNILVCGDENGAWQIGGIIDWEAAATGSPLWDIGNLFRYHRRYVEGFRTRFAHGHEAAGGKLPTDWWLLARTIDSTLLVALLSEEREMPGVFADCVELIEEIVADLNRTVRC
jgi:aminoglycoside phosphotransferase (APT) family kinase protein